MNDELMFALAFALAVSWAASWQPDRSNGKARIPTLLPARIAK